MWRRSSFCNNSACVEADGPWVKATASNPSGNCVEAQWTTGVCDSAACVEAAWTHAPCESNECVEVVPNTDPACPWVHVRDSKFNGTENQPVLVFPREEWANGGVIDFIPVSTPADELTGLADAMAASAALGHSTDTDWYMVLGTQENGEPAALFFDQPEVGAFIHGIRVREFAIA
jgi:hypothetical protein